MLSHDPGVVTINILVVGCGEKLYERSSEFVAISNSCLDALKTPFVTTIRRKGEILPFTL